MIKLKGKYVVASLLMLLTTGVIVGGYVGNTSSKFSKVKASETVATCEDNTDEVVDDVILCDEMSLEDLGISEHYENEEITEDGSVNKGGSGGFTGEKIDSDCLEPIGYEYYGSSEHVITVSCGKTRPLGRTFISTAEAHLCGSIWGRDREIDIPNSKVEYKISPNEEFSCPSSVDEREFRFRWVWQKYVLRQKKIIFENGNVVNTIYNEVYVEKPVRGEVYHKDK